MRWLWGELGAGRIDAVIRGAGVVIVAGVLAGGGAYVIQGDDEAEANAFINTDASGDTCTYSATPITFEEAESNGWLCGTFDAAYDEIRTETGAACGGTVLIRAGTYPPQSMTGYRNNCPTDESGMTLFAPEGYDCDAEEYPTEDTPVVFTTNGLSIGEFANAVGHVTLCGLTWPISTATVNDPSTGNAVDNSRYGADFGKGSRYLTIKRSRFGGFGIFVTGYDESNTGDGHIGMLFNWIGPCHEYGSACSGNGKLDIVENVTLTGNYFNQFRALDNCIGGTGPGQNDCGHHEPMFVNGVTGMTINRNRFWNYEQSGAIFLTCSGPDIAAIAGGYCLKDTLIENNWIESPHSTCAGCQEPNEGGEWGESAARPSNNCALGDPDSLDNVIIRNNTIVGALTYVGINDCDLGTNGVQIVGNIANRVTTDGSCAEAGLTMDYNITHIYSTNGAAHCGSNNHSSTLASTFLEDPVWASSTQDIHQIPGSSIVDDFVPDQYCSDEDYDGDPRAAGNCDAGADED